MRIEVIGYKGVVGGATYKLFSELGYGPIGYDKGDVIAKADVYFICVPEGAVEKVVDQINVWEGPLVVIRSSVPPRTCTRLSNKIAYLHICHNPEFLREAIADQDEFTPHKIVIG